MTFATKILGFGLLAVVAGCGGATDCELPSDTQCPGGYKQIKGAQAVGKRSLTGGEVVGSEDCSFVCCGEGTRIDEDSCADKSTEGPEGTTEGVEGDAGPEGPEGEVEGPEGTTEGPEGTVEGPEGETEGPEGKPEGAEGAPPDAGVPDAGAEPLDAGEPDCETVCEKAGRECGDKPEGCPGQCGSCDKLPEPVCLDEKTSRTFTFPKGEPPAECSPDGRCQWNSLDEPCIAPNTCGAVEPGKCSCKALTVQTACLDKQKDCGSIANECGGTVNCGECTAPNTCGGGGTENVCGCPVCTAPETCGGGGKPGACGAPGGTVYWAQRFGGAGGDLGHSVAVDGSGNIVVAGAFRGTVDFGSGGLTSAGDYDIFVARYDAVGTRLWNQRFGGTGDDRVFSVAADAAGNVVITGYLQGTVDFGGGELTSEGGTDVFVAKYDAGGTHVWSQPFGGTSYDEANSVAVDGTGSALVTGRFQDTVDFGGGGLTSGGGADVFVAKYDAGGTYVWSRRFGGTYNDGSLAVAVDGAGNVFVTGGFGVAANFGGGDLTGAGYDDIFVAKYDAAGNHVWSKGFGGTGYDAGHSVAVDGAGNVFVTGYFAGTVDFGGGAFTSAGDYDIFVAGYDAAGNHVWSKGFGGKGADYGYSVAVDGAGNVVVAGDFQGTVDFGGGGLSSGGSSDVFVVKYGAAGNHLWSKRFGGTDGDYGRFTAVDGAGNVLVTGVFSDTVDFGGIPLTSAGENDIFLLKLAK